MHSVRCLFSLVSRRNFTILHQNHLLPVSVTYLQAHLSKCFQRRNCTIPASTNSPIIMKLDTPEFKSLFTHAFCQLAAIFEESSYELRIAGGAVRDLLLGIKPKDIDFATTATPSQMKDLFHRHNVRMIHLKGETHGTITTRFDQENFEVTTLRIDVETDGRHASVEFTTDWKLDASRRDLTINSMYLGLDGTLYDYFNGYNDLINRRIVFVGDTKKRINEDFLRILRYFRFYGRIAEGPNNHDPECLQIIDDNIHGLQRISGERIWMELQKIVIGNYPNDILKTMHKIRLFPLLGLPWHPNFNELDEVIERTKNMKIHPITYIASMLKDAEEMYKFHARCKLSSYERDLGVFIINNRNEINGSLVTYQRLIVYNKQRSAIVKEWVIELLKYKGDSVFTRDIKAWTIPLFPVSGCVLMKGGVPGGKKLGLVIDHLKVLWADGEFKLTSDELLKYVPDILKELGIENNFDLNKIKRTGN